MALWGIGTKFQRGDGAATEVFADVGEITSITPPSSTLDTADSTTLDSPDGREQVVPTILRNGEATLNVNFDPSDVDQTSFRDDMEARALKNYRIVFPDTSNTHFQFAAYVTGFSIGDVTPDGLLSATVTLRATGKPEFGTAV